MLTLVIDDTVDENGLDGNLPTQIGELTRLRRLQLCCNSLVSFFSFSSILSPSMSRKRTLFVFLVANFTSSVSSTTKKSGEIPTALSTLTYLRWLNLGANQFTGTIPDAMSQMTHLTDLDLWRNQLTGTIPESLGDLTRLTHIDISRNQLTGTMPNSLGGLTILQTLRMHRNELTGDLDSVFCFRTVPTSFLFPFWADCAGPDPKVTCSCCSACH